MRSGHLGQARATSTAAEAHANRSRAPSSPRSRRRSSRSRTDPAARSSRRRSPASRSEPELVAAIAAADVPSVLGALDELLASDFIRPTETPRRFRFRHPIVRRAVYDGDPAGMAARCPCAGGGGARSCPRASRPCAPSHVEKLGDRRRRASDLAAGPGGTRRGVARARGRRPLAARGRPAAPPDRRRRAPSVPARGGGGRAHVCRRLRRRP